MAVKLIGMCDWVRQTTDEEKEPIQSKRTRDRWNVRDRFMAASDRCLGYENCSRMS